jgi:hypothetical protein
MVIPPKKKKKSTHELITQGTPHNKTCVSSESARERENKIDP